MKIKEFDYKTWEVLKNIKGKIAYHKTLRIIWKRQQNNQHHFNYEENEEGALAELERLEAIEIYTEPVSLRDPAA